MSGGGLKELTDQPRFQGRRCLPRSADVRRRKVELVIQDLSAHHPAGFSQLPSKLLSGAGSSWPSRVVDIQFSALRAALPAEAAEHATDPICEA